jgi:predicted nucleotidyltransferase
MKYHSKHFSRDEKLPGIRDRMVSEIIQNIAKIPGIEAIFLGGSLAKNNYDLFSDIDLRIVVSEDHYDEFIYEKQRIASEFGEVLFYEDLNPKAPFTIAHYSNFLKVDLFIYTFSRMSPSIWLQGIKIVLDPTGELQSILDQSNVINYEVTKKEVDKWRGKIFSYIHEVYRRVMREEYYYALTMINNLRSFIVSGWNMEAGRHSNDPWDWSKIEGNRSQLEKWQLTLLGEWFCGRDQKDIMLTMNRIVEEFKRLHDVLCDKTGLEKEENKFNQIIDQVL